MDIGPRGVNAGDAVRWSDDEELVVVFGEEEECREGEGDGERAPNAGVVMHLSLLTSNKKSWEAWVEYRIA